MVKGNWILCLLCVCLFLPACIVEINDDDDGGFNNNCIRGQGGIVSADFNLDYFVGIKLQVNARVFVTQGSDQTVRVEAEQNIIDLLELDVQNDIWEIEFNECVRDHDVISIFIQMPDIRFLSVSGPGVIRGENLFEVNEIDLRISGSGDMDLALNADHIDSRISGSGKMFLEGNTEEFDFDISGSGDYRAFNLTALRGDIDVSGSGDSEVRVEDDLDIQINGSGDVYYRGFPALDVAINGSGRVINAN